MAATPPTRLRVAVGLKQDMVEIDAYPDTTWESAKLEACVAAGDLDATTHRLLFRGREPAPEDTVGGLGVKPTAKLMLLETEASKRARARQQQEAQMEEMRRARAAEFSSSSRGGNQHAGETKTKTTTNETNATDPVARSLSALAERAERADALERDLEALEMAVAASSASSAGAAGARAPPEEKAFVAFADACEKAVIGCDDVATHGDDRTRAARKALVTRLQGLLKRVDDARARHGDA
jgi:Tfp pilus assembly protein PilV